MDINMPVLDRRKWSSNLYNKLPVIMYSTSVYEPDIEDAYKGGSNLYVPKPTCFEKLVGILENILSCDLENLGQAERNKFIYTLK